MPIFPTTSRVFESPIKNAIIAAQSVITNKTTAYMTIESDFHHLSSAAGPAEGEGVVKNRVEGTAGGSCRTAIHA